jgi:hypothetical protein
MSFADAEIRAAASVMGRLANATAQVGDGGAFSVIFDKAYLSALDGQITAIQPKFQALDTDLAANAIASGLVLRVVVPAAGVDADFTVRDLQPDGTGLTDVLLEAL